VAVGVGSGVGVGDGNGVGIADAVDSALGEAGLGEVEL
jgi:hypothetical protein